jgi:outer membrane protein
MSRILFLSTLLLLTLPAVAQQTVVVGVVDDGPSDRLVGQQQKYINELLALTESEFDVQIRQFSGAWSKQSMEAALDNAYADVDVDMVLVTGFVSNQLAAIRAEFPKPTFLPVILDTGLLTDEPIGGVSGIRNLNYLSAYADFSNDLDALARITDFQRLVLLVDANLSSAIPALRDTASEEALARGVELLQVTHDGLDHALMNQVPGDTDAIFVAALPRMPAEDFERLVESINAAGLPSYSFVGVSDVERGLLATNTEPKDIDRQARLNALNMQAVMLGELAENQPVASSVKDQLTINMATARRIGLSPSFDVLGDSVLLNQEEAVFGEIFGLVEIANLALAENQDLLAESYGAQAGLEEISSARSNLFPQVGLSASSILRNDSPSVSLGLLAERSSDAALSFDQLIYSDAASANLRIQKELQRTRMASLQEFRLDVIQAATTSYYQVLNARSQLDVLVNNLTITRANLELAENRVRVGNSTAADVYRWQAEVARAQIEELQARASLNQAWETLSRVLHRPQGERLVLRAANFDEPFVMTRAEFDKLVRSPADYAKFSRFYIDRALTQAPELEQLDAQVVAKQRELTSQRRAYWLPDFSLSGGYTSNLSQSGLGAGLAAGEGLDDWNVGVQATLPLFSGGVKRSNVSKAQFELRQLQTLRISTEERIEEQVRIQLHATQAAYGQIDLTATAAEASRKNFDLVSDAYARGAVTVIELLDAQDTSRAASAAAAESLHSFLITIMSLQRAVGGFDYLLSEQDRNELAAQFRASITGTR